MLRMPSLEMNWLPASMRKGLSLPRIVVIDDFEFGGQYWRRTPERYITPFDMDLREGAVIVLNADHRAATIAHEFRHHWQREALGHPGGSTWNPASNSTADYWREIRRFFRAYWHEWDALRFELAMAPDDVNREWFDRLQSERNVEVVA